MYRAVVIPSLLQCRDVSPGLSIDNASNIWRNFTGMPCTLSLPFIGIAMSPTWRFGSLTIRLLHVIRMDDQCMPSQFFMVNWRLEGHPCSTTKMLWRKPYSTVTSSQWIWKPQLLIESTAESCASFKTGTDGKLWAASRNITRPVFVTRTSSAPIVLNAMIPDWDGRAISMFTDALYNSRSSVNLKDYLIIIEILTFSALPYKSYSAVSLGWRLT